ncbi:MAG: P1 family peptidase [Chloroflexota bacterium]
MTNQTLTAINGVLVGHWTDTANATGCTVVHCPDGTVGGVDQRGGAPGTRETDLLRPMHTVNHINAIVLSGGSAFGLASADGVMRYLREQNIGFPTGSGVNVPIVPSAILYDLEIGNPIPPTADAGYEAAVAATDAPVVSGNTGAGAGCTVGKILGMGQASKGGLGNAAIQVGDGLIVTAMVAVNAIGDILDENGAILTGVRNPAGGYLRTLDLMRNMAENPPPPTQNTVIGIVATNAKLNKEQANKIAQMAHNGLARAVNPAHTMYDGDTIFTMATGEIDADVNVVGAFGAEVMADAIRDAVRSASDLANVPSLNTPT